MRVTPEDILQGPIGPVLRRMTLPMVYGIAAIFLFQTVDMLFISMLGTQPLAAISFVLPITFTVTSLTLGLTIALSIIVGKAIGAGRMNTAARITTNGMLVGIVIVALVSIGGLLTIDALFTAMGASEATILLIHEYLDVWYVFAIFLVIPYLGNSAIRATGDTKWPSILMMVAGLVNVIMDPILIFGWGPVPAMGIRGAAIATVVSWIVTFIGSIWLLVVREKLVVFNRPDLSQFILDTRELFRLGTPISLANVAIPVGISVLTALVAREGETAVAGFGAGSRIEMMAMVVALALTAALSPYMAQNYGANNHQRATAAMRIALKFGFFFQLGMYGLLVVSAGTLGGLFSDDPQVISVIKLYLWVLPIGGVFYALFIIYNTAFNANGKSSLTLLTTIVRLFVLLLPLAWLGQHYFGLIGLYIAVVITNALSVIVSRYLFNRNFVTGPTKSPTPTSLAP